MSYIVTALLPTCEVNAKREITVQNLSRNNAAGWSGTDSLSLSSIVIDKKRSKRQSEAEWQ